MVDLLLLFLRYGGFFAIVLSLIGIALAAVQHHDARWPYQRHEARHAGVISAVVGLIGAAMMWGSFYVQP
jgi:hypothetical protein